MTAMTTDFPPEFRDLLDSQFATLEPLDPDERGVTLDVDQPIDALVAACVAALGVQGATS